MSESKTPETHEFQAEVQQLLDLMIHSLYSNREIFLRELISNAADAADRLRFEALQAPELNEDDPEPRIEIRIDEKARTVSVIDNGTGMDRTEVIDHLGTIARSGTRRFLEALSNDERENAQLIGQFGVGFYSAFIVADKVTVHTRRAGLAPEDGVLWTSEGKGQFEITALPREARGTEVTLHLGAEQDEFLDSFRLKSIVRRYSDHIAIPISIADENGELETINQASALWMRPKSELSDSDYQDFYRQLTFDTEPPLATLHNKVEGAQAYTSLLFLPGQAPFDLFEPEGRSGLRLYVRRVFIMEDREHRLMPRYLRFVRGIIDSDDLPLNVSRELLQHNRLIDRIRAASVKRVLDALERLAKEDSERYSRFWKAFGTVLKEGPVEDPANAERIAGLLRFYSTHETSTPDVSLVDYVSRMKPDQDAIYYLTGESFSAVSNSPHLEAFRKHELEVLLLAEPVDEWLTTHLTEFDGRPLKAITKGQLDLNQSESTEPPAESVSALIERIKTALGDRVSDVRVSNRLTDSPACLVVDEGELGIHMQRMLKAAGHDLPSQQPILEINPEHAIIERLSEMAEESIDDWAALLFEQSILMEGGRLDDPASFVRRMNRLLD